MLSSDVLPWNPPEGDESSVHRRCRSCRLRPRQSTPKLNENPASASRGTVAGFRGPFFQGVNPTRLLGEAFRNNKGRGGPDGARVSRKPVLSSTALGIDQSANMADPAWNGISYPRLPISRTERTAKTQRRILHAGDERHRRKQENASSGRNSDGHETACA